MEIRIIIDGDAADTVTRLARYMGVDEQQFVTDAISVYASILDQAKDGDMIALVNIEKMTLNVAKGVRVTPDRKPEMYG